MKEIWQDEKGVEYKFSHWRIAPPGHKLPVKIGGETRYIPPEAIFVDEHGNAFGFSPNAPWLQEDEDGLD